MPTPATHRGANLCRQRMAPRRGIGLIELVSVAAIVCIAAAVAVPALSRAREHERATICLQNLGRFGQAISFYVADQADVLPGPIHMTVPYNAASIFLPQAFPGRQWYRFQLPSYLAPYLGVGGQDGPPADVAGYCPTAAGIATAHSDGQPYYYQPKSYYVVNSATSNLFSKPNLQPYYHTNPPAYFGYVDYSTQPIVVMPDSPRAPKQLEAIANASQEWAIADLWHWEAAPPRSTARNVGTWPYLVSDQGNSSVTNGGALKTPSYPIHLTTKSFSPTGTDRTFGTPRLTSGRTNAVFFDSHAESVRNWQGSVNPCFDENDDNRCD